MPGDSNILLRIDSASKAVWQERARREGLSLTRLIIVCVEEGLGLAVEEKAASGNEVASSSERLGAVAPPVTVHPPLPAPAARVEPAPSTPAVAPPPRPAAGREHSAMCTCLMCKG